MEFNVRERYFLLFFSALLFGLSWLTHGFTLFLAFVPLLFLEDYFYRHKSEYKSGIMFRFAFLIFVLWHAFINWWIGYASVSGLIMAILMNTTFFATIFWLFHLAKRKVGQNTGYAIFIVFWLSFEYLHNYWELSWPWMNLGNWLAHDIHLIQWYEFTGVRGGSLWILLVNLLVFAIIKLYFTTKNKRQINLASIALLALLSIPTGFSLYRFYTYKEAKNPVDIVVIQPNIDPYNDKYDYKQRTYQLNNIIALSDSLADKNVDYFVGPETAFPRGDWESHLHRNGTVLSIRKYLKKYPQAEYIIGLSSYKKYPPTKSKPSPTAVPLRGSKDIFYDRYNTAIQIDTTKNLPLYHKSQLVLGVEKMPFLNYIPAIEKLAMDFGGIVGSLGEDKERKVFTNKNNKARVGVIICYESTYSEFVTEYVKNGANLLFIITNDGWWKNTLGHVQHLYLAQARAIETRRSIARSANTGTSAFVNQLGELSQATAWWKRDVIRQKINTNENITFYVRHGDFIGRISSFLSILMILYTLIKFIIPEDKLKI